MTTYDILEIIFSIACFLVFVPIIFSIILKDREEKRYSKKKILLFLSFIILLTINVMWEVMKLI